MLRLTPLKLLYALAILFILKTLLLKRQIVGYGNFLEERLMSQPIKIQLLDTAVMAHTMSN